MAHAVPARLSSPYSAAAGRRFGLTVGTAFLVVAIVAYWRGHSAGVIVLATCLAVALVMGAIVVPTKLGPAERAWMALATAISKVTTPVFMAVVYFLVLTPTGLLRRTFGARPLVHRVGPHGFWADRSQAPRSSLDRQF